MFYVQSYDEKTGLYWRKTEHGNFPGKTKQEAKDKADSAANAAMKRLWRTRQWEELVRRGAVR